MKRSASFVGACAAALVTTSLFAAPALAGVAGPITYYAYADGSAVSPTACQDVGLASSASGCSLDSALSLAHAGDTIDLATPGSVGSYSHVYVITTITTTQNPLTIQTDPALTELAKLTGDQTGATILTVNTGINLVLSKITFSNTASATLVPPKGGAINNSGALTINNCTFTGNYAANGGAIDNADHSTGTLTINGSTFTGNVSNGGTGGAIDNADDNGNGDLSVDRSSFVSNRADSYNGGAIDNGDDTGTGSAIITNSTFSGNQAHVNGGAIDNGDYGGHAVAIIRNSTFVGNSVASGIGGAIAVMVAKVVLTTSTTVGNFNSTSTQADGVYSYGGLLYGGDIIGDECSFAAGTVNLGYNLLQDTGCDTGAVTTDQTSADVPTQLYALADNGGPVQTIRPVVWSNALGIIPNGTSTADTGYGTVQLCPRTDARGLSAPDTLACSAGAIDVFKQVPLAITSTSGSFGKPLPLTYSGGSGSGQAVFAMASGSTAQGCAIKGTNQAPTLISTSVGTCYVILNVAADQLYQSATSPVVHVTINPAVASPPRLATASPRNKSAAVHWIAPTSTGGAALTGYTVTASPTVKGVAHKCATKATACTVTGLQNKVTYRFSIVANNSVGKSPAAMTAPVIAGSPAAPRITRVAPVVKGKSVVISWTAPSLTNGSSVIGYQVSWSTNGGKSFGSFKSIGKSVSVVRAGLSSTGRYAIKVRAVNSAGPGEAAVRSFTSKG